MVASFGNSQEHRNFRLWDVIGIYYIHSLYLSIRDGH